MLISGTTADLLADGLPEDAALLPLGVHRLRDLRQPERVFQLSHPELRSGFPPLRSLDALPNNLPVQLTSFVGREAELAELVALAAGHRLITLVGVGGCGKTRLAAHLAAELAEAYPDGLWWTELARVTDPARVPWAVMGALGLGDDRGLDPVERITTYVGEGRVLLVVDNCEHVLAPSAAMLDGILRACPQVAALATSREPLGVPGEVVWRVPPLSLPGEEAGGDSTSESVVESEGVRLFAERALDARPGFRIDASNAETVAAICRRLDGLPLGIELAAARVRSLSPERILDGLADRFRLLTGGARTALARQQTLQASVEWSHHLLSDAERIVFRRLAAFLGGFSLEAAEGVAAGEPVEASAVLGVLSDLVDKSLVTFDGERYGLLQTIHDFANAELLASGEAVEVRDRHAAHYLSVAESASGELERELRSDLLAALERDHDNLRVALEWLVAKDDDTPAVRLVVALALFWLQHGHFSEGLAWHRRVIRSIPSTTSSIRCKVTWGLGHLSLNCMDLSSAGFGIGEIQEAVDIARQLGDPGLLARPLSDLGAFQAFGVPGEPEVSWQEAIAAGREAGDRWAVAHALWWQAFYCVRNLNEPARAEPLLAELEEMGGRAGNIGCLRWNDVVIGIAAWYEGRAGEARAAMERAVAGAHECNDPLLEAYAVGFLSDALIALGDYEGAGAVMLRTAVRLRRALDVCREGFVEFGLARLALARGDLVEAASQTAALAGITRQAGLPILIEWLCQLEGRIALERGDLTKARSAFDELSSVTETGGVPWNLAAAHHVRGLLARAEGDRTAAEDFYHHALALQNRHGFRGAATETLEALASLAGAADAHGEAARLFGAAQSLRLATGQIRWPLDQPAYDADLAQLRAALGDDPFDRAWSEGTALSLEEAASYASRARGERKRPRTGWAALTPTELEVAALAGQGLTNPEIGQRMFISAGTVRIHLSHIYAKLGIANRAQLAAQVAAREAAGRPS